MITLTDNAINKIKEIADGEGLKYSIRVKVIGNACAGFANDMQFDEIVNDLDEIFKYNDVQLIIDSLSLQYLDGSTIDYTDRDFNMGFVFLNPNIRSSCGCGNSYNV